MDGVCAAMEDRKHQSGGFTLYQLLVSIVVLIIVGSLWLAYDKSKKMKPTGQTSSVEQLRYG
jgi:heme/copper-type cytochrome/quinol oxidase subunit 4